MIEHPSERPGADILPWTANVYRRPPRHVVIEDDPAAEDDERWHWPSFGWGSVAGFYLGSLATCAAAWLWGFYL